MIRVRNAGKTWEGGRFVARPSMMRRADCKKSSEYKSLNGETYAGRSIVIDVFWLVLSSDGHKTLEDGRGKIVTLNLRLFAGKEDKTPFK